MSGFTTRHTARLFETKAMDYTSIEIAAQQLVNTQVVAQEMQKRQKTYTVQGKQALICLTSGQCLISILKMNFK